MFGIPDPSSLLRPWKDLKQFSEELYAMMVGSGEQEQSLAAKSAAPRQRPQAEPGERPADEPISPQPTRIKNPPALPPPARVDTVRATRLDQARSRTQPDLQGGTSRPPLGFTEQSPVPFGSNPQRNETVETTQQDVPGREYETPAPIATRRVDAAASSSQGTGYEEPGAPPLRRPDEKSNATADDDPVPDEKYEKPKHRRPWKINWTKVPFGPVPMGVSESGGTTVFLGQVVSGSGNEYTVDIYGDGPDQDPTDKGVKVKLLNVSGDDQIPAKWWLESIFQFQDNDGNNIYYCSPPVWMP